MNKSERKFHNTAQKMHNALFYLMEKKDFTDISIIELCSEAKVNRSTFYAHYSNTYDLLKDAYSDRLQSFFDSYNKTLKNIEELDAKDSIFISADYLIPYLDFVKENRNFFITYMSKLQYFGVDDTYSILLEKIFLPICYKNGISDRTIVNYMSKFYLQGITSIALEWAINGCVDDKYLICEIIIMCVRPYIK